MTTADQKTTSKVSQLATIVESSGLGKGLPAKPAVRLAAQAARKPIQANPTNSARKPVPAIRACGDCRACCTAFDIPEVGKGLNEHCRHEGDPGSPGCKIYGHRPEVCRKFECAWKQGLAGDRDRPDQLGVMFYTVTLEDGGHGLAIVETTPGAFGTRRVRDLVNLYQSRKPGRIILRRAEDRRFKHASILIEGKPLADGAFARVTTAHAD